MDEAQIRRLRWQCRRGMTELDRLLGWWLERRAPGADATECDAFVGLLGAEDTELWTWFIGRATPPRTDWKRIVDDVRAHYRA